jgi:hypothetical protein
MADTAWKSLFVSWPAELNRRGILVTAFGEQIPFSGFLTAEGLLLLERSTPDSMGARTVMLPYDQVAAIKLTDVA